jgi:hypothetical protein
MILIEKNIKFGKFWVQKNLGPKNLGPKKLGPYKLGSKSFGQTKFWSKQNLDPRPAKNLVQKVWSKLGQ